MAKLGNTEYPDIGLLECLNTARTIKLDFGGEIKRSGLAHILGMSPSGGAFAARLGSMRMWGIISGRSTLRLTDAASRTIGDSDAGSEPTYAVELAQGVPLFNMLHARLHAGTADKAVLAATVQELTDAPMTDVNSKLPQIERLFNEVRRYMEPTVSNRAPAPERADESGVTSRGTVIVRDQNPDRETQATPSMTLSFDGGEMVMEETPDNIDLFITALVTRKRKLMEPNTDSTPSTDSI